jgi:hypothetical protein
MDIDAASEQYHWSISLNERSFATYSGSPLPMRRIVVLMFTFTLSRANSHKSRHTAFSGADVVQGAVRDRRNRSTTRRLADSPPSRRHALGVAKLVHVTWLSCSVWGVG